MQNRHQKVSSKRGENRFHQLNESPPRQGSKEQNIMEAPVERSARFRFASTVAAATPTHPTSHQPPEPQRQRSPVRSARDSWRIYMSCKGRKEGRKEGEPGAWRAEWHRRALTCRDHRWARARRQKHRGGEEQRRREAPPHRARRRRLGRHRGSGRVESESVQSVSVAVRVRRKKIVRLVWVVGEEGRQEWDARLPTRRQLDSPRSLLLAGRRFFALPCRAQAALAVAGPLFIYRRSCGWVGLTGAQWDSIVEGDMRPAKWVSHVAWTGTGPYRYHSGSSSRARRRARGFRPSPRRRDASGGHLVTARSRLVSSRR